VAGKTPEVVGQYHVYELLGRGGMATVHRAETQGISGFRRPVALKRLMAHLATDAELVQSFVHEARLASHLRHANCAQTYDLGKVDETYFIAMEYVPGANLQQIMRQCEAAAGLMPIPIALNILLQTLDGLDHAHCLSDDTTGKPLGIVHRDVSPSNIIVSNTGVVKLIDFGIAKAESLGKERTQTGLIKGKFGYVAPEYTYGQLDARCDLFAVGVIAHEIITGKRLFDGKDSYETIQMLREGPIQPPSRYRPDVSRELDDIVMTALMRDPVLRWQSAAAMRTALGNLAHDEKLEVSSQQVFEWVEWAFTQESRNEESVLVRVIDTLGEPSTGTKQLSDDDLEELDEASRTQIRHHDTTMSPLLRAPVEKKPRPERALNFARFETKPKGSRTWMLVVFFLVVIAAASVYAGMTLYDYEIDL
jgi:eukaryotic-like serine/threonine-protein kinase